MQWLTENTQLGKKRDDIQPGFYTYPEGSHFIVYRESNEGIEIARVLHQSMDIEQRLSD